jgi:hypothetical protein
MASRTRERRRIKEISVNDKNVLIRPVEESDAEVLADLAARTFFDAYSSILPIEDLDDYLRKAFSTDQMLQCIADPHVLLFLGSVSNVLCS